MMVVGREDYARSGTNCHAVVVVVESGVVVVEDTICSYRIVS